MAAIFLSLIMLIPAITACSSSPPVNTTEIPLTIEDAPEEAVALDIWNEFVGRRGRRAGQVQGQNATFRARKRGQDELSGRRSRPELYVQEGINQNSEQVKFRTDFMSDIISVREGYIVEIVGKVQGMQFGYLNVRISWLKVVDPPGGDTNPPAEYSAPESSPKEVAMDRYHSTVSRREFLKALGLGSAGLAAAAVAPPVFHDLDEVMSSSQAVLKRPSWVKEVDKPTVEVNWDVMQRFNYYEVMWAGGFKKALGAEQYDEVLRTSTRNLLQWRLENKPGYTLADTALNGCSTQATISFLGPRTSATPEKLGVPRWEGTPEENARLVRAFLRIHGAAHVGFVELNNDTEKLIAAYDGAKIMSVQGPRLDILDVDQPEDNPEDPVTGGGGNRVIPKKARWAVVFTLRMSPELIHRAPGLISSREHSYMYDLRTLVQGQLQNFMRTLGYMCLGDTLPYAAFCQSTGFAVLAGLGETCRIMHTLTPDYGLMQRVFVVLTDLPLAPGKPVDFGVMGFCRTCKKCADYCPVQAIPDDTEPNWEINGPYNRDGVRIWHRNEPLCRAYIYVAGACAKCFAVCPYSKTHKSSYTNAWQSAVANAPVSTAWCVKWMTFWDTGRARGTISRNSGNSNCRLSAGPDRRSVCG